MIIQNSRILILGGGISGLALAYYLSKHPFEITLIEQSGRPGGWIDSDTSTGFFFEKGPRVFRGARCTALLSLIREIGMEEEIIEASTYARRRYLWKNKELKRVPMLSWGLIQGVLSDLTAKPCPADDESVWDFALRRFNKQVATDFFDPLVTGIYGGGIREASIEMCFPRFKMWEKEFGSVIKGALKEPRFSGPYMFSLKRGLKSLIQRLEAATPIDFHYGERVIELKPYERGFEVVTTQKQYLADFVFSALPCQTIGKLFVPQLLNIPLRGTTLVNLGYHKHVVKKRAFGYLVGSQENEDVLGVTFDSLAFPQFNHRDQETRLTVMLKEGDLSESAARSVALKALQNHLGITEPPLVSHVTRAPGVFPQMHVGHRQRMEAIESSLHPRLKLVGNYLYGVGVSDCIERARSVAANFLR